MGIKFSVELEGWEKLIAELPKTSIKAYRALDKVLGEWAVTLWAYCKQNHPWKSRTGRLMKSHYYQKNSGNWKTMEPIEWEVGADTRRNGTSKNEWKFGSRLMKAW